MQTDTHKSIKVYVAVYAEFNSDGLKAARRAPQFSKR